MKGTDEVPRLSCRERGERQKNIKETAARTVARIKSSTCDAKQVTALDGDFRKNPSEGVMSTLKSK